MYVSPVINVLRSPILFSKNVTIHGICRMSQYLQLWANFLGFYERKRSMLLTLEKIRLSRRVYLNTIASRLVHAGLYGSLNYRECCGCFHLVFYLFQRLIWLRWLAAHEFNMCSTPASVCAHVSEKNKIKKRIHQSLNGKGWEHFSAALQREEREMSFYWSLCSCQI